MWLFNSSYYFICTVYTHTRIQIEFSPAFRLASSCWIAKIFVRVDSHSQCCCSADKWSIKNSIVCSLAFPSEFCAWRWAPRLFVDLNTKSYTHIVCICTGGMKRMENYEWQERENVCYWCRIKLWLGRRIGSTLSNGNYAELIERNLLIWLVWGSTHIEHEANLCDLFDVNREKTNKAPNFKSQFVDFLRAIWLPSSN